MGGREKKLNSTGDVVAAVNEGVAKAAEKVQQPATK